MATKQEKMDRGDLVDDELENEDLDSEEELEDNEDESEDDQENGDDEDNDDEDPDEDEDVSDGDGDDDDSSEEGDEDSKDDDEGDEDDGVDEEEDQRIPRSRLNQVIKQRDEEKNRTQWLEDQLEKLIEKQTTKEVQEEKKLPEYDFNASETQYIELILEGDTAKAIALRNEIENARASAWEQKFSGDTKETKRVAKEEAQASIEEDRFDSMIENYENKHSFLDLDSDDYNEEAVETVNTLMAGYQAGGETKSQSLKKAVIKVAPMYEPQKKKEPVKKKGLGDRTKTARKRNAKASQQQPAKNKGKKSDGRDLDTLDPSKLSEKEFRNLTPREKKVLRGD